MSYKNFIFILFLIYLSLSTAFLGGIVEHFFDKDVKDIALNLSKEAKVIIDKNSINNLKIISKTNDKILISIFDLDTNKFLIRQIDSEFLYKSETKILDNNLIISCIKNNYLINLENLNFKELKDRLFLKYLFIFFFALLVFCVLFYFVAVYCSKFLKNLKSKEILKFIYNEFNPYIKSILVSSEFFDTDPKKNLISIKNSSLIMQNLCDNLNYLSGYEFQDKNENVGLKILINDRIFYFNDLIASKNLKLSTNIDDIYINTNRQMLEVVLDNLIIDFILHSFAKDEILILLTNFTLTISAKRFNLMQNNQNSYFNIRLNSAKKIIDKLNFDTNIELRNNLMSFSIKFN